MSQVAVRSELIRWARERSGLTHEALLKRFPKFDQWERGEAMPTLRQLTDLAKKTLTPLGYFFLPEPPEEKLPIPDYRTVHDGVVKRPSPNLLETVQTMQRRQGWMRDYLIEQGARANAVIGSVRLSDDVSSAASRIREALGLSVGWAHQHSTWTEALRTLFRAVEKAGILVVINGVVGNNGHRKLDPNEFRGFVLSDEYAPLIFINGADAKAAQMFTLSHELVHLWLGKPGVINFEDLMPFNSDLEKFCNRVAAELLIPEAKLRAVWRDVEHEEEPFQVLARRFKVSPLVAARRSLDLGLIERQVFFDFYRQYQEDERRRHLTKPSGGDFYATQDFRIGRRFARAVVRAAKEGRLLYRDAYQLTGLYGETFDRYAKTLGDRG